MRTLRLKNLSEYLISKGHVAEYKALNNMTKQAMEWPWEVWNNLPEKSRDEIKSFLDTISWIPVIGVGGDSAKFILSIYEEDYFGAARSLLMLILNFVIQIKMIGRVMVLQKSSGKALSEFIIALKTNRELQGEVIGFGLNIIDSQIDTISDALRPYTSDMMLNLSKEFEKQKNGFYETSSKMLNQWTLGLQLWMFQG